MKKKIIELIETLRKHPCHACGCIDENGNHILGYDNTDVDELLLRYYKKGTVLCKDCLFK